MTDADRPAFAQALSRLVVALREKAPDAVTMRVYFEALKDSEIEFIVMAAQRLAQESTWFPKTSELRTMAATVERERLEAQRALLRKLPSPLCPACSDTGWRPDADGCVHQCDCLKLRRLELLGRRPWPALQAPPVSDGESGHVKEL